MVRAANAELARLTIVPGILPPLCLAVTLLTSHSQDDLGEIGLSGSLKDLSARLAQLAVEAGAGGVVAATGPGTGAGT